MVQLTGACNVTGHPDTLSSYRLELTGVLGNLIVLNLLFEAYNINHLTLPTLFCYNEGAVTITNGIIKDPQVTEFGDVISDRDLLFEMQNEIRTMKCTFIVWWIPSHQDDKLKKLTFPLKKSSTVSVIY